MPDGPVQRRDCARADGEVLVAIEVLGASELGVTSKHREVVLEHPKGVVNQVA